MAKRAKDVTEMSIPELKAAIERYDRLGYVPAKEVNRYDSIVRRLRYLAP